MNYYHINGLKDINYKKILEDYRRFFSGRAAELKTNYKLIEQEELCR